ncbi:MAG TPA: universal stress protein [Streptosporangiaceae bacterium]|nr:universal stress protein [Streptosporangiaceae bacterium]
MKPDLVVVGTDGSDQSFSAVEWAAREAMLRGAALRIVAVPVMPKRMSWRDEPEGTPDVVADLIASSYERALAEAAEHAAETEPGLAVDTALVPGSASALIAAAAGASMLVVGSRGAGGFAALLLGSVSRYVATGADCPVVVVREESMAVHREVVVGVRDLDQPAAIGFAFQEAALRKARLRAVHAWQVFLSEMRLTGTERPGADADAVTAEVSEWLTGLLSFWREKYPEVDVIEDVVHAAPGRVLAAASARADLIVLGRNGGESRHPGADPVIHAVLNHAHGPVAIIPE